MLTIRPNVKVSAIDDINIDDLSAVSLRVCIGNKWPRIAYILLRMTFEMRETLRQTL